ncbi:M24 family metallopeptidase [Pseudonocardia acaciae]|uniref:M24 family metallopeptidase n=1 Tax=Pseudonocardia acaciae TaxID=551276 RepID=UPI000B273350|nr:Xaa-Pro peptidase family protein [Pseudonocardia acaciae]
MTSGRKLERLGDGPEPQWLTDEAIGAVEVLEPPPFEPAEYDARMRRVCARLTELDADALLVFRPSSVEYLCGYHTQETAPQPLLVTHEGARLYVMDLEVGRALASSSADEIVYTGYDNTRDRDELVTAHVRRTLGTGGRLAVELQGATTPPAVIDRLRSLGLALVDGRFLVETLRLVLSPAELRCMEEAARITALGLDAAVGAAREPAATDSTVAAAIAAALHREADSRSAWGPLVVSEPRAGVPHSTFRSEPLAAPGSTFLEFAGTHHRYHAPVMRTVVRGRPSPVTLRLADRSRTALAAVLAHAKAGVACSEVARRAREALGPLEADEVFHWMFGYPVGLAHPPHWMDGAPFCLTADNPGLLQAGMTFHVPASFRSFGAQCVGLSQTFVVEPDGARALTHGAAELIEL